MSLGPEGVALPTGALGEPPRVGADGKYREASVGQVEGLDGAGTRYADRYPASQRDVANVIDGVGVRAWYRVQARWQAHGYGQVARSDVEAVNARDRGDRIGVLRPASGLDHGYAGHSGADGARVAPERLRGPQRPEAATAAGIDAAGVDGLAGVVGGLDHREDDAMSAGIQDPPGRGGVPGRHPDHDRTPRPRESHHACQQAVIAEQPVLRIQADEVESLQCDELCGERRSGRAPAAERRQLPLQACLERVAVQSRSPQRSWPRSGTALLRADRLTKLRSSRSKLS